MAMNKKYEYNAVKLFRNSQAGVLSTISQRNKGYPFGSYTTFMSGRDRSLYFYLSDIAQHTINFKKNSKASLTIVNQNTKGDKQNSQRLSLLGDITNLTKQETKNYKEKFHIIFPESKKYADFHGFNLYKMELNDIRWIGGFGKIGWLETERWKTQLPEWYSKEKKIVNHMNDDHKNSIISSLKAQHNIEDENAKMLFLTIDGYYVNCSKGIYFVQLDKSCFSSEEYRKELIKLAKLNRKFEVK